MPNLINEILADELASHVQSMGSCLVVSFDKMTAAQAEDIRNQFRKQGMRLRVVRNRLAQRVFRDAGLDIDAALTGKCGIVFADEERAITAARILRETTVAQKLKEPPFTVAGGVIEGQPITGSLAGTIADMPDRHTVRGQIATAISGPARMLATCVQGVAGGLARVIQARIDKQQESAGAT
jgi:large subunit ribosomal protein L10